MLIAGKDYRTVWMNGSSVYMINQTLLPHKFEIHECRSVEDTAQAIKTMIIRGAPALGAAAAYGLAQAALAYSEGDFNEYIDYAKKLLASTRPTAHDLFFALQKVHKAMQKTNSIQEAQDAALKSAQDYADESINICKKIGEHGSILIKEHASIMTHCNAGALCAVDYGTALAPIRKAHEEKKRIFVFVNETRPRMQGSQLTAFELSEEGIDHAIIADNAAGHYMQKGEVDLVITGADRVAANGDTANKIGTYEKAVLAKENGVPFYVAIPLSTIDFTTSDGSEIIIEERDQNEQLYSSGWTDKGEFERVRVAPMKSSAKNPAFDVTPARYIDGFITPLGIFKPSELSQLRRYQHGMGNEE